MSVTSHCTSCGATINPDTHFCQTCGAPNKPNASTTSPVSNKKQSPKSGKVALLLCLFFGFLGMHRFYVGKIGTGLLSLLTLGGLGLWNIIDIILITQNKFKDMDGRYLTLSNTLSSMTKFMLTIGFLVLWVVLLLASLILATSYLTQGLVNTANNQLAALRKGNLVAAYSYNSTEYHKVVSLQQYKTWLNQVPELKNNIEASFTNRGLNSYEGFLNLGFLEGTLTAQDGTKVKVRYLFIKEHGTWRILRIIRS